MGKKKLETNMVEDRKKGKEHFSISTRLEGLFKRAKETSPTQSFWMVLRQEEKQNRERNSKLGINLEESYYSVLKDMSSLGVSDSCTTVRLDHQLGFPNFGHDHGNQSFLGSENVLLFDEPLASINFVSDCNQGQDRLVMDEANYLPTDPIAAIEDTKYSTDMLQLSSQEEMMEEFLKDNLFDSLSHFDLGKSCLYDDEVFISNLQQNLKRLYI